MVVISANHLSEPGLGLSQTAAIDDHVVIDHDRPHQPPSSVRVAPGASQWRFETQFFHMEQRSEWKTVYYDETEWVSCASRDSRGNCESGTRRVSRSRLERVTSLERVSDGACDWQGAYVLQAGRSYRVSYLFSAAEQCQVSCFDVSDGELGTPCARPAALPVAPRTRAVREAGRGRTSAAATSPSTERPLRGAGIASVVVGSAMLLGGAGAGIFAARQKAVVADHCDADHTCDARGLEAARDGQTASTLSTVGVGAGGALLVGGIALLVFGPAKKLPATVAPTHGGAQLTVGGSF